MKHQQLKIVLFCPILITKQNHCKSTTEGPRIVQILCSQGIIQLRNCTKQGLVLEGAEQKKFTDVFKFGGNILGQSASKCENKLFTIKFP